jgi:C2H2-type zinc finger
VNTEISSSIGEVAMADDNNHFIRYCDISGMDQGEPGVDYDEPNLNPLVCDICNKTFDSLDKLGEHQKQAHDM